MPQLAPDLEIVDALPYVDREYEARKAEVDLLIEQEMNQMAEKDYLEPLGVPVEPFLNNPRLRAEYERVVAGKPIPSLDMSRYEAPEAPANRKRKAQEWREAVANAEAQLEQQEVRLMNLELLNTYGANVWVKHNAETEATKRRTELALKAYQEEITKVNQKRKEEQLTAGNALHQLKMQWYELVAKNRMIEADCARMEQAIACKKQTSSSLSESGSQSTASQPSPTDDAETATIEVSGSPSASEPSDRADAHDFSAMEAPGGGDGDVVMTEADRKEDENTEGSVSEDSDSTEEKAKEVRAFVQGLLVKELKEELKARALPVTGRKAELAARLEEYMLNHSSS